MICTRCLRRLGFARGSLPRSSTSGRTFTNTHIIRSEPPMNPPAPLPSTTPAFSTPFTNPSSTSKRHDIKISRPKCKTVAGTVMRGLGYIKGQEHPIAGEDDEYPDWLWGLLDRKGESGTSSEEGAKGDMFSKSKNQRRIALKAARKAARDPASQIPKVPYDRQTIDLPVAESQDGRVEGDMAGGPRGWEEAQRAREDLTHAMRNRRRKEIKDSNFLKSIKT